MEVYTKRRVEVTEEVKEEKGVREKAEIEKRKNKRRGEDRGERDKGEIKEKENKKRKKKD